MKLTGKAKEQFEKWFKFKWREKGSASIGLAKFYSLPNSMQWGVYEDWADSIGVELEVNRYQDMDTEEYDGYSHYVQYYSIEDPDSEYAINKTRQEARNAAIEKLNQLINET